MEVNLSKVQACQNLAFLSIACPPVKASDNGGWNHVVTEENGAMADPSGVLRYI
jgi:hypothetical protein